LLSGMALANSGLGMAHGVAAALGVHCRIPHGLACATMLPIALTANLKIGHPLHMFLIQISMFLSDDRSLSPEDREMLAIDKIRQVNQRMGIPSRLGELGVTAEQIPDIVRSSRGNSMDGNPRDISDEELDAILRANL